MKRVALALLVACGAPAGPSTPVVRPEKTLQINTTGQAVDLVPQLAPGYVTVVDFWADYCGACTVVGGMLAVQVAQEPSIVIRKIDVGDSDTPVAKQYDIGALPHFRLYDKRGQMRYVIVGNDTLQAPTLAKQLAAEP